MSPLAHARKLMPLLIVVIVLAGIVAGVRLAQREPQRVALAPIDRDVPRELSTATFGMG